MSRNGSASEDEEPDAIDLRLLAPATGAWLGALLVGAGAALLGAIGAAVLVGLGWARMRRSPLGLVLVVTLVAGVGVLLVGTVRVQRIAADPVAALARDGVATKVIAQVTSDPRVREGRFGTVVIATVRLERAMARGATYAVRTPALVIGDDSWRQVSLGSRMEFRGTLSQAEDPELGAVIRARGSPTVRSRPDVWWRGAERIRASLRQSVAHRSVDQRSLVPALVVGDDAGMKPELQEQFRATGLTHLTAVSGTNLTLLVGFLVLIGNRVGVRGRGRYAIVVIGIVGFLLLARGEPSVLRAATMGTVALLGLASNGRSLGTRALGAAVIVLLLLDPGLGRSVGFALSVLATAGILLIAPGLRDAMKSWFPRWMPRGVAEAIAIPLAAQLACTPIVAAISGQVSLVAVLANLMVAPAVGPATVLGLIAGLVGLLSAFVATWPGTLASWCVAWIIVVAERGAALPTAQVAWGTNAAAIALLTVVTALVTWLLPLLLRTAAGSFACGVVSIGAILVHLPTPGWPPAQWIMIACDVGQGDALLLNAGAGRAVVVDVGPDPRALDQCLRRARVEEVPLALLTHAHADHIAGLQAVAGDYRLGQIEVGPFHDQREGGGDEVDEVAAAAHIPIVRAGAGSTRSLGPLAWQELWPPPDVATLATRGSAVNNASVVWLVESRGVRLLLTGDIEPEAQARLARTIPGLRVDVLKVPHHGSRHQDLGFLTSLGARLALVSVGADNDYGHPSADVMVPLEAAGARVFRPIWPVMWPWSYATGRWVR